QTVHAASHAEGRETPSPDSAHLGYQHRCTERHHATTPRAARPLGPTRAGAGAISWQVVSLLRLSGMPSVSRGPSPTCLCSPGPFLGVIARDPQCARSGPAGTKLNPIPDRRIDTAARPRAAVS